MKTISQIEPKTQNSYQTPLWRPGDQLPHHHPDAWSALQRNADAYEQHLRDEERRHFADRRAA
jgi:hypothetical protein